MARGYGSSDHHLDDPMWWDAAVLLIAVAAGALAVAVLAVLRPSLPARLPAWLVWVAAAASAVAMALSEAAPTGWSGLDLALRVAFGALVPLAAARAGTISTTWLLVAAVATLLIADAPAEVVAAVAAGAFLSLAAAGATSPAAAAIAAAAGIGPMGHVDWPLFTGVSAIALGLATTPVLLVGLVRSRRPVRTWILVAATVAVVVLGLGAVVGLLSALDARDDVDAAVDFATTGIDQLGDDDEAAWRNLLESAGSFETATSTLETWWAKPALLVPGVSQQMRAVATMASAGADLARTAADATDDADVDSVQPVDGRIDLDALAALEDPLRRSLESLRRADARLEDIDSPLLLGPVAERLTTLRTEVDGALGSAELAAHAVEVAPEMLGADGPRRYFVAFQNPAEITGNGGFLGNWAELVADDGELVLVRTGRNRELTDGGPDPDGRRIEGEEDYLRNYPYDAARYWGTINYSPDHPTVSRIMAQLYPQSGGTGPVDGVIAITPAAMAGFLELTGPIEVAGYAERLAPDNVERILLHEQYLSFPDQGDEDREAFLSDAVRELFDQLTAGELPGPRAIAAELSPAVHARQLQLWSAHADEQALFRRIGATGEVQRGDVDSFGVVTQNFNGNKIDWFLHRETTYDLAWDPDSGEASGTISASIRNEAPSSGLPRSIIGWGGDESLGQRPVADGENFMLVTVYATLPIEQITVDGEPVAFTGSDELGHHAGRLFLSLPSQSGRQVVAHVRGVVPATSRYILRPIRQPTINADQVTIRVRVSDGWNVDSVAGGSVGDGGAVAVTRENASERIRLAVDVERDADRLTWLDRLRLGG